MCKGYAFARESAANDTRSLWAVIGVAFVLMFVPDHAGRSQVPMQNVGGVGNYKPYYPSIQRPVDSSDGGDQVAMERQLNALNTERQKEMVSDTNKLLKLATELNEEVAANNSATLTDDQLRKMAQIEKLARGIKQKMADGVGRPVQPVAGPPVNQIPQ
ncbi:MAG: hypothetical protein ACLP07_12800 [Terracidiphilus sp.]